MSGQEFNQAVYFEQRIGCLVLVAIAIVICCIIVGLLVQGDMAPGVTP
jgi:hypothetical protein